MLTKSPTINQVPRSMVRWIQDVLCMSDIVCRQGKGRGGGVEEKKLKVGPFIFSVEFSMAVYNHNLPNGHAFH